MGTGRPEGRAGHQWGPRAPDSSQHKWPQPGSFAPLPCRRLHPLQPPWSPDLTPPGPGLSHPLRAEGAGWGVAAASAVPPPPRRGQGGQFREGGTQGKAQSRARWEGGQPVSRVPPPPGPPSAATRQVAPNSCGRSVLVQLSIRYAPLYHPPALHWAAPALTLARLPFPEGTEQGAGEARPTGQWVDMPHSVRRAAPSRLRRSPAHTHDRPAFGQSSGHTCHGAWFSGCRAQAAPR